MNALILEDGGVNPFLGHLQKMTEKELKDFFQGEIANRPKELFEKYDTEVEAYEAIKNYSDTAYTERYKNFSFIKFNQHKYSIYAGIDTVYGMDSYASLSRLMKKNPHTNPFANQLMELDYTNIIQNVDVPTLLLEARSQDDLFDDAAYYEASSLSNSKIEHKIFEHSNHNIHFSEPEKFITTIINFLNTQQYDHTRSTGNSR